MDIETTARMLWLVEGAGKGHTPYFIKRCVYAISKKEGGGRTALNKAFAICVAQAQKRGDLKKGSMEPTKDSVSKKKTKSSSGFSLKRYDQQLKMARTENVSLVTVYAELQEELQIEQHVNEGGVKKAVHRTEAALTELSAAIDEQSLVSIPGILADLFSATLGRNSILGELGVRGLLSAVDLNPASFGQDLKIMVQTFKNVLINKIKWQAAEVAVKAARSELRGVLRTKEEDGQLSQEGIISILGDFFIELKKVMTVLVRGIPEKRAKNAALVLQMDMEEISDGCIFLAGTAKG